MKISWALNCTFLMLSGSWNKAGPFWLIKAPETDAFWWFQEPEIVKKALFYFRGLKSSKRCNLRSLKLTKSSREPLCLPSEHLILISFRHTPHNSNRRRNYNFEEKMHRSQDIPSIYFGPLYFCCYLL